MTVIDPAVTLQVSDNDKVLEPYRLVGRDDAEPLRQGRQVLVVVAHP